MIKKIFLPILAFTSLSSSVLATDPEEVITRRINNHFLVEDYESAAIEAQEALAQNPHSKVLFEGCIKALARSGNERLCLAKWHEYTQRFPEDESARDRLLEEMAWGTINKTAASHSPPLRLMGILAAFLSQDARGMSIIKHGYHDPNILIRVATVKLSANLHDALAQEEIAKLVATEKCWKVRVEAIKTAGAMKITRLRPQLMHIAGDSSCHALEQAAAIGALVQMQKSISREELWRLVQSDRAGMRMLACEIVAHLELKEHLDLLMPLLKDHSSLVRAQALHTLGLLRAPINVEKGVVVTLMEDPDPTVAITAAWVVTLSNPTKGQHFLENSIKSVDSDVRRQAAAALVATGKYGFPLIEKSFNETQDPYVRLNLALGLIGQRSQTEKAAEVVFEALASNKELWMQDAAGKFTAIAPSTVKHDEVIPNAPEAINQKTRLELLNILAVLKHPRAQEAVKLFLQEKKWGITGIAAAVLLTEGDEPALELVKDLLNDKDPIVRLQAAMVLALWGGGEDALAVLEDAYADASFEDKEKIIEGIARVGSKKSLDFFVDKLDEPHQSLRLIAAAGLLMTLYN